MSDGLDNLGRLVAAERNALAAIQLAQQLSAKLAAAEKRIDQLQTENAQRDAQLAAFNVRLAVMVGSGATSV